jgi:ribosomal protein S20
MAITQGAKKAHRASLRKRVFNLRRARDLELAVKEIKKLISEKKTKEALALVPKAYKAIDKASKTNAILKGAGSRKKARLMAMVNRAIKKN